MTSTAHWLLILFSLAVGQTPATPDEIDGDTPRSVDAPVVDEPIANSIRVLLRPDRTIIPVGSAVNVEFVIQNKTASAVTLAVPGALKGQESYDHGIGLPLEHVFSGVNFRGMEVAAENNPEMGHRITRKPQYPVPPVTIAPFGTVGLRFDVARFYPGLHQAGKYVLNWKPYGGAVESGPLSIEVVAFKQAIIETSEGSMMMTLLYDKAPKHVQNFIELAQQRAYNAKTFHLVYQNQFVLGGDPKGDGTGKRPDGATISPEFNDTPFELGTVGMALIEGNPNSGSCQFFICLGRQPAWDGKYTAFGKIQGPESLETLKRLGQVQTDEDHRPKEPLKIKSITISDMPYIPRDGE